MSYLEAPPRPTAEQTVSEEVVKPVLTENHFSEFKLAVAPPQQEGFPAKPVSRATALKTLETVRRVDPDMALRMGDALYGSESRNPDRLPEEERMGIEVAMAKAAIGVMRRLGDFVLAERRAEAAYAFVQQQYGLEEVQKPGQPPYLVFEPAESQKETIVLVSNNTLIFRRQLVYDS